MRQSYHADLDAVIADLVQMADFVQVAVHDATHALIDADLAAAEQVITNDATLDAMHDSLEGRCFMILARQAPVAGELRTLVAALRMTFELARMGDLAAHIAKIARLRYPDKAVPDALQPNFERMATLAESMIVVATGTLRDRNTDDASELANDDEEMDELRREQFRVMLSDDWAYGVEKAVDAALLGRYYERIADHAVALGRRIIYILTGDVPEGENWPNTY